MPELPHLALAPQYVTLSTSLSVRPPTHKLPRQLGLRL